MAGFSERLGAALQSTAARVVVGAIAVAAVILILFVVVKPIVLPDASPGSARPSASTSAAGATGSAAPGTSGTPAPSTDASGATSSDSPGATDAASEEPSDSGGPTATAPSAATLLPQLRSFMAKNDALYRASDTPALFATLNRIVVDTYGAARCRRAIAAYAATDFKTTIRKATGPEDWTFEAPDGTKTVLSDVYTVDITRVRNNGSSRATVHIAWSPVGLTWFSGC